MAATHSSYAPWPALLAALCCMCANVASRQQDGAGLTHACAFHCRILAGQSSRGGRLCPWRGRVESCTKAAVLVPQKAAGSEHKVCQLICAGPLQLHWCSLHWQHSRATCAR